MTNPTTRTQSCIALASNGDYVRYDGTPYRAPSTVDDAVYYRLMTADGAQYHGYLTGKDKTPAA